MVRVKSTDTPVLWAGLLGGPVAWAVHLQGTFALSAWATERAGPVPLHALSAVCVIAALASGALAFRAWRTVGGLPSGTEPPGVARVCYLGAVGVMTGALSVCVIVAQWVAVFMLPRTTGAAG